MNDRDEGRHPDEATLHGYAEEDLRPDAAADVEDHLRSCPPCRREVEEIRELLRRAGELPRGFEPPRDLWPGVEARVRAGPGEERSALAFPGRPGTEDGAGEAPGHARRAGGRRTPVHRLREAGPWLAAAAAVLVAVTAGATLWLAGGTDGGSDPADAGVASARAGDSAARASQVLVGVDRVQAGYRPMVDRLSALLESRSGRLPPETRQVVERNLRIIDAAIAEAESALAEHPASPELIRALDRSYERKIDLLRRSARLTAQM